MSSGEEKEEEEDDDEEEEEEEEEESGKGKEKHVEYHEMSNEMDFVDSIKKIKIKKNSRYS